MKTSILPLFVIGAVLTITSPQIGLADTTTPPSTSDSTSTGGNCEQGGKFERMKAALASLGLTDAQKTQIKQIRSTVTDKKERRQQIMAVLTPDQKAKLIQMIREHRNGGAAPSST